MPPRRKPSPQTRQVSDAAAPPLTGDRRSENSFRRRDRAGKKNLNRVDGLSHETRVGPDMAASSRHDGGAEAPQTNCGMIE